MSGVEVELAEGGGILPRMNVSLFVTCLTESFYPRAGVAVVKVLERLGHRVDFPQQQTCCGQPQWNNGFVDEARVLARRMVRAFADSECVVAPSGSCVAMVRHYYPELLGDDPEDGARCRRLVERTYEFSEFLVKVLRVDLATLGARAVGRMTYHYSCHLRGLGVTDQTQQLLRQIEGIEFVPLERSEECCGFGGTFAVKYPQVSEAMLADKLACIRETGADVVVVNDAGCMMNIAGGAHRAGMGVEFKHIAEVVAEGLGLLAPEPVS